MAQSVKQWVPLESNPYILTRFGRALGLPPDVSFVDVWSLDLLDIVPQPCHAVILLYPLTEPLLNAGQSNQQRQQEGEQSLPYFCKQTISNACGTIALLHAALNATDLTLTKNSFLDDFRNQTLSMSPDERAALLNESSSLDTVHCQFANEGQSAVPENLDKIDTHFVCFVHHNGTLYQLDGRLDAPVGHGPTSEDTFLNDTAAVMQSAFMAADPSEHRFTIVALAASPDSGFSESK